MNPTRNLRQCHFGASWTSSTTCSIYVYAKLTTTTLAHLEQTVLSAQILLCKADVYTACLVQYQAPHVKTKLVLTSGVYIYIRFQVFGSVCYSVSSPTHGSKWWLIWLSLFHISWSYISFKKKQLSVSCSLKFPSEPWYIELFIASLCCLHNLFCYKASSYGKENLIILSNYT